MIKSMTGFGKAEKVAGGFSAAVEVRSVNQRFLEVTSRLPRVLSGADNRVKDLVQSRVKRGHVSVNVTLEGDEGGGSILRVDDRAAEAYLRALRRLQRKHRLKGEADLRLLAGLPNLFHEERKPLSQDAAWRRVRPVFERALADMVRMRAREGRKIALDLTQRIRAILKIVSAIEERAPERAALAKEKLAKRITGLLGEGRVAEEKVLSEAALLADRYDVAEECQRLRSHCDQFGSYLKSPDESGVGRRLDFLLQEMFREANTIGSKANDAGIAQKVVHAKEELERAREQVQNVE